MNIEKPSSKRQDGPRILRARAARISRFGRRGGVALLEFALVVPVLLAIVLGIIDFGQLERSTLALGNAAREGARAASLGQATPDIRSRLLNVARPPLQTDAAGNITNGSITLEQGIRSSTGLSYQSWPPDSGTAPNQKNSVARGNYVRVTILYNHRSITGLFNRAVAIPVVMRRE